MNLYIRQKIFSWVDRFTVKDAYGQDRYHVEGELFSWGKKLHIYDPTGTEVATIRQKLWSFLPRYHVFVNETPIAEIIKKITFLRPQYRIEGLDWEIHGDLWSHDYVIRQGGRPVVAIHKEWMTWGDCYELEIADARDEICALAVVLTIDCVTDDSASTVAGS